MARGRVGKRVGKHRTSWYYVFDLPAGADGERRQAYEGGYDTRKQAEAALQRAMQHRRVPGRKTYAEFIRDDYLPNQESALRPSTLASYRRNLDKHVLPAIGHRRLRDLTPRDLNALYHTLASETGLSARTRRYIHTIIRRTLALAVRWDEVDTNAADRASPPSASQAQPPAPTVWTGEQLGRFLNATSGERDAALWVLYADTGARRGELLALRWPRVDLDAGTIRIEEAVTTISSRPVWGEPKTRHGRRTIALSSASVTALQEHRKRQAAERLLLGLGASHDGLVFAKPDGTLLAPDGITRRFNRLAARAGLPKCRLHDLRHAWGTHAHHIGVPVQAIKERLGHHSTAFTMATYVHGAADGADAAAAELVAANRSA